MYFRVAFCFLGVQVLLASQRGALDAQTRRRVLRELRDLRRFQHRPDAWCFATLTEAALAHRAGNRALAIARLRSVIQHAAQHRIDSQVGCAAHSLRVLNAPMDDCGQYVRLNVGIRDPERWLRTFSLSFEALG